MKKNKRKANKFITLGIILLSFLVIILLGAIILYLPISHKESLSFIDSLFLSFSSVCITGLSPIKNISETLTIFGKIILAILIEIGGLGIVTFVMFLAILFGFKITINQRALLKEALNQNALGGIVVIIKKIVLTTLIIQLFGFILNFISFYFIENIPFFDSIGYSLFHSISSFNNCGFDILGSNSLINYSNNVLLNISTCLMIFCGGIGFIVIFDIIQKRRFKKLSLHSKIILSMTLFLLITSTLLFKLLNNNLTWLQAIFLSFSSRTGGFFTFDITTLSQASIFLLMILMFIGAGPMSTGGGIKVSTFFTIIFSLFSFARGNDTDINIFKRKIPSSQITKSFVLFNISIIFITLITFLLLIIENNFEFYQLLFEVFSAFSTTGFSLSITPLLSNISKILLCLTMYFGRLGPITIISLFHNNEAKISIDTIKYVEEEIIIG